MHPPGGEVELPRSVGGARRVSHIVAEDLAIAVGHHQLIVHHQAVRTSCEIPEPVVCHTTSTRAGIDNIERAVVSGHK